MWKIWWAPNNASRWQMGFNSAFKRLISSLFLNICYDLIMQIETHMHRLETFHCIILYRQTIKNRINVWLCPTFSLFSKSSLKAHSLRRAGSSVMEARVSRNCSALPSGMSGFATWASWIFDLSSSVGSIVSSFCSNKNNVSASHLWHQYPKQLSMCVYAFH